MPDEQVEFTKFSTVVNPINQAYQGPWQLTENARVADGNVTFVDLPADANQTTTGSVQTQTLCCSTLASNTIPANATIVGIEIEIKRLNNKDATSAVSNTPVGKGWRSIILDSSIRLFNNTTRQHIGEDYFNLNQTWKESVSNFGSNFEVVKYGGATDTWNITPSSLLNTNNLLSGIGFSLTVIYNWELVDLGGLN